MTRARDLADSADKDIAGTLTLDDLSVSGTADVTGDLTVDTDTLYVDTTNDRVGIGHTNPQKKLEVWTGNTELSHFGSNNANASGSYTGISLGYAESGNQSYRKVGIVSAGTGDGAARQNLHFLLDTNSDGGSVDLGDTKMKIDYNGRVTTPYQPAFSAHLTSNQANVTGATIYYDLICNSTQQNRGNHFSTSTGRFTAPIAGLYLFTAHILFSNQSSGRATEFWFDVNGQTQRWFVDRKILSSTSYSMQTVNGSAVISLSANDYVIPRGFVLGGSQDVSIVGSGGLASVVTNFTGYLIG